MPTKLDVITRAFRELEILAIDEAPSAHDYAHAEIALEALFAELPAARGMVFDFTLDDVPTTHVLPLASLLAAQIAGDYARTPFLPFTSALVRLQAVNNPYSRDMDLSGDGTTTDEEIGAFDRGAYF